LVCQITNAAIVNAAELVKTAAGTATLCGVINSCANDAPRLESVLSTVVAIPGGAGDDALFEVISNASSSNAELATETMRVLREALEVSFCLSSPLLLLCVIAIQFRTFSCVVAATCINHGYCCVYSRQREAYERNGGLASGRSSSPGAIVFACTCFSCATTQSLAIYLYLSLSCTAQAALTATSDQRAKLQALRMADHTLTMLSHAKMDVAGAQLFFKGKGVESLMQVRA
jgi:hypothetical protein